MKCTLVGGFNAKTAVLEDFSEPDDTQCECRPNNFGRTLLEKCNSRIGKDKNIGTKTCNDIDLRVVDYLILSSNLFSVIILKIDIKYTFLVRFHIFSRNDRLV